MHMVCVSVRMYACIDLCVDMNVFYVNIDADTCVDTNVDMLDLHRVQLDYTCGTLVCVLFVYFFVLCITTLVDLGLSGACDITSYALLWMSCLKQHARSAPYCLMALDPHTAILLYIHIYIKKRNNTT